MHAREKMLDISMKHSFLHFYIFVLFCLIVSTPAEAKQTICLNMIVKNERHVITRCLNSVKPIIDYWIIVDTGSTDNTQGVIQECMKGIPGELYERPWKNFAHNRNEALQLAKGKADYLLFMDADDWLEFEPNFLLPSSSSIGMYKVNRTTKNHSFSFANHQMIRDDLPWRWVGVVHEYLQCDLPYTTALLTNVSYIIGGDGASHSDSKKFLKYVALLKEGLKEEPNNSRYVFYLGESYRFAGKPQEALEWYTKRTTMGGWEEEIFWSFLQIALLKKELGYSTDEVIQGLKQTHQLRPHRVEPIYYLADLYIHLGRHDLAFATIQSRVHLNKDSLRRDTLFNLDWMDRYGLLFQLSICGYYVGEYRKAIDACDTLLSTKDIPHNIRSQTEKNRLFSLNKLGGMVKVSPALQNVQHLKRRMRTHHSQTRFHPSF